MTKIITWCELRYLTLAELEALFRTLQIELGRTAPGSRERGRFKSAPETAGHCPRLSACFRSQDVSVRSGARCFQVSRHYQTYTLPAVEFEMLNFENRWPRQRRRKSCLEFIRVSSYSSS